MTAAMVWDFVARNWAFVGITTTLVLLVVVPCVILRKYIRIALNIMNDPSPPVWPGSREAPQLAGEEVAFSAFDGHTLYGTLLQGDPLVPRKGLVIFAHEFEQDRRSCFCYSQVLRRAGYDVFAFDFRGHGASPPEIGYKPRQLVSDREQFDVLGAIAHAEDILEQQGRPREVGLLGLSRGGGAAILGAVGIDSVAAIAVDGAYSNDSTIEYLLKRWASIFAKLRFAYENHPPTFWRFLRWLIVIKGQKQFGCRFPSVRKALRRMSGKPVLFIHGQRDSYVPPEQAQLLYNVAADPKDLWIVLGARHNQSIVVQPDEYAQRIVGFFDRYLAGAAASQASPESRRVATEFGRSTNGEQLAPSAGAASLN